MSSKENIQTVRTFFEAMGHGNNQGLLALAAEDGIALAALVDEALDAPVKPARAQAIAGHALRQWGHHAEAREQLISAVDVLRTDPDTDTVSALGELAGWVTALLTMAVIRLIGVACLGRPRSPEVAAADSHSGVPLHVSHAEQDFHLGFSPKCAQILWCRQPPGSTKRRISR